MEEEDHQRQFAEPFHVLWRQRNISNREACRTVSGYVEKISVREASKTVSGFVKTEEHQ